MIFPENIIPYKNYLNWLHQQLTRLDSINRETQNHHTSSNRLTDSEIEKIMEDFYRAYANLLCLPIGNNPILSNETANEIYVNWDQTNLRLTPSEKNSLACRIEKEAIQLKSCEQKRLFTTLFPPELNSHSMFSDVNQTRFYSPLYEKLFHLISPKSASTTAVKRQAITQHPIKRKAKLQSKKITKKLVKKKANSKSKKRRIKQPPQSSTAESLATESSPTEAIIPTIKTNTLKFNAVDPQAEARLLSFSPDFFNQKSKQYEHETGELTVFEDPFRAIPKEILFQYGKTS